MPESPDADRLQTDRQPLDRQPVDPQQLEALEEELRAARQKRDTYQGLLKELPEVFEGKFRERLRPVQQRNEQLIEEGMALRDQIRRALPQAEAAGSLPAASAPPPLQTGQTQPPQGAATPPTSSGAPRPALDRPWLRRLDTLLQPLQQRPGVGMAILAATLGIFLGSAAVLSSRQRGGPPTAPGTGTVTAPTSSAVPTPTKPRPPATREAVAAGPALLTVRTLGPSWIEVRGPADELLFSDELNGVRSFPLARGLRIRSGRADLVRIRVKGGAERTLGSVEDLSWKSIPAATATVPAPRPSAP